MDNRNHIIELVVYRLKNFPFESKRVLLDQTNAGLTKLEGYLHRKVYQSTEDPYLFLDYVAWDTLENALNGAKNMNEIPELVEFIQLIEKTELFDHFRISNQHFVYHQETKTVALAVYQLKENDNHRIGEFFATYNTEIEKSVGYKNRVLLQSTQNKNLWAERVFWENIASAKNNEQFMQHNSTFDAIFSIVENVIIMKHFLEIS